MKHSVPVSLFSFQDIITCLTGIMIVIVLVILLQLVEALTKMTAQSELKPVYESRKLERDLLKEREKELRQSLMKLAEENRKPAKKTPEEFIRQVNRERAYYKHILQKANTAEAALRKEEELQKKLNEKKQELARKEQQLSDQKQDLQKTEEAVDRLLAEAQQSRQALAAKMKKVRFTFSGLNGRIPILIECNDWGFSAKEYPDGKVHRFGMKDKTNADQQLSYLDDYVKGFDKEKIYLVFFFRPGTLEQEDRITTLFAEYNLGKEPLGKEETCIDE